MRQDNRPYWVWQIRNRFEALYCRHFLEPQFDSVGKGLHTALPWCIDVWGANIHIGKEVHIRAARGNRVNLSTWDNGNRCGEIYIGDYALISPGTRILSSEKISIGRNSMLASDCYVSDSDWHSPYNRTIEGDRHAPVILEENVWLGKGVIVGKGVRIGENSIIGAGAVVTSDIRANVMAAGNPARVIKELDPARQMTRRSDLLANPGKLKKEVDQLQHYLLRNNTILSWLRSLLAPARKD